MAVYHATRGRAGAFGIDPARASGATIVRPGAGAIPRRRTRVVLRAGRRSEGRVGLVLGGIIVAFVLAFFSLAQTVQVSATAYDIDRLLVERSRLEAQRQELLNDLTRLGREPAIRKGAISAGLTPLGEPLVVPGR